MTKNAFQPLLKSAYGNAFVSELNANGTSLIYSTYLGGSGYYAGDSGLGIAVDAQGNNFIAGQTFSSDFPVTTGAFQTKLPGPYSGFVTRLQLPRPSYFSVVPNVTATLGQTCILKAQLDDNWTNLGIPNDKVLFSLNGSQIGTPTTDAHGNASLTLVVSDSLTVGKTYAIPTVFNGDSVYAPSAGSGTLSVIVGGSQFTSPPNATGKQGTSVTFTVKLVRTSDGKPIIKQGVSFTLDGTTIGYMATDNTGTASVNYAIPANAKVGGHPTLVAFRGNADYASCSAAGTLTVTN